MYHWQLNAVFVAYAELKALSSNRLEVFRLHAVCGGSDAVSVYRFNDSMGARSRWVLSEGLHCDVHFVLLEAEVRYLDLTARMLFLGNLDIMR